MVPFWKQVMTRNPGLAPNLKYPTSRLVELWKLISIPEIRLAYPPKKTTPAKMDSQQGYLDLCQPLSSRGFSTSSCCASASQPTFARIKNNLDPQEERSVYTKRLQTNYCIVRNHQDVYKILGNRLRQVSLDERQRAFREFDGCSDIFLLDFVLRHHRQKNKHLYMASTDIAKAYDSVSFEALREIMHAKALPDDMINYVMYVYEHSKTKQ